MILKCVVFFVLIVSVLSDVRVKRAKYSYPSRFYRKPPPPHVIKGPFSYTPPPNYMHDDEPSFRPKVSRKPANDGLGDEDISNLIKYLSKKDLDKIVEFAGEKERYAEKYRDDSNEFKHFRRPERNSGYKNEDLEQFAQNIHHFKQQDDLIKVEYSDPSMNYAAERPRILHPTPPTYPNDFDKNLNTNYVNDASQPKVIYTNPPETYKPKVTYSNHQEQQFSNMPRSNQNVIFTNSQSQFPNPSFPNPNPQIFSNQNQISMLNNNPSNPTFNSNYQGPYSNSPLDTEESMRQYITYVTYPPPHSQDKEVLFTDSETMKEEQLPKPLNLREDDDYEVANTDNVPKVVKSNAYTVESFKDVPLMNSHDSKLHTVSSYNVPHYLVTSTRSQSPQSQPSRPAKPSVEQAPTIEQAPPGYTGKEMSDAHLKAVKIWTHRSKGTAYTLHDDGTLSLEKPKIRTSYGYAP